MADKAGLLVGDMILAVNGEDFVGASYETAARVLKQTDGEIKMIVANPNLPSAATVAAAVATEAAGSGKISIVSPEKPKLTPKPTIAPKPRGVGAKSGGTLERGEKAAAVVGKKSSVGAADNKVEKVDTTRCPIVPGQDTIIEIVKDKDEEGLGLSIVGGSDTLLGAIFIHEVYEAGKIKYFYHHYLFKLCKAVGPHLFTFPAFQY